MKTIIDLVLVAILVICAWTGYKKGIIMGIGGVLVIIISLYGANLLSNAFSSAVVPVMKPFVTGFIEGKMVTKPGSDVLGVLDQLEIDTSTTSLEDLIRETPSLESTVSVGVFEALGINESTAKNMASEVSSAYEAKGGAFTDAISTVLCNRMAFVATFILAFLIILIFLTVIGNLTNLSFKIPNLDWFNDIVGALLGILTGLIFCTIVVWALKYMGLLIGGDTVSKTILAKSFMDADRLTKILGK